MAGNPLTPDQLAQIERFFQIIRENGGYGEVRIVLTNGEVKYINLGEVSAKAVKERE